MLCNIIFVIEDGRKSEFSPATNPTTSLFDVPSSNPTTSLFDVPSYREFSFISGRNYKKTEQNG